MCLLAGIVILQVISCPQHEKHMCRGKGASCFNVGTLSPCWCLHVGAAAEGSVQWRGWGCLCFLCSYFHPLLHPLCLSVSDHWLTHLKTASHRVRPITPFNWAVKQWRKWKVIKGNSTFQSGSSWSQPAYRFPGKTLLWEPKKRFAVALNLYAFTAMVSERNVKSLVRQPRGPPHLSHVTYSCKAVFACEWHIISTRQDNEIQKKKHMVYHLIRVRIKRG